MDTKQFMDRTNLKFPRQVSRFIKYGVIKPIKLSGCFEYSEEDVDRTKKYLTNKKSIVLYKGDEQPETPEQKLERLNAENILLEQELKNFELKEKLENFKDKGI